MEQKLTITSPAFENEAKIPIEYTGYGADISPELHLSAIHAAAKSIAVVMDDLNHPIPGYNHWIIWNLPMMQVIPENIPHGTHVKTLGNAVQGRGYGKNRYQGPKPPFNWSHRYRFSVYVLDSLIDLPSSSKKRDLLKAMQGHILQQGELIGRYR